MVLKIRRVANPSQAVNGSNGNSGEPEPAYQALNAAYPRSWWLTCWSHDVKRGRVLPLRVLEQDIALWRDQDGVVHCQAAHCPHLGAHLGHMGEVLGNTIRCTFHGICYDASGGAVAAAGPERVRSGLCLPTYRVIEKYGAVFLWNGPGEPDFDFPDVLAEAGFKEEDVTFAHHRLFMDFPAKWFLENVCDGMHFAVAHDSAEYGDTTVEYESATMLRLRNRIYNRRRWLRWENIKRRFLRRELINLLTPVTNDVLDTTWGGTVNFVRFADRPGILGNLIACWTPIDANTHWVLDITFVPKIRIPVIGRAAEKTLGFLAGIGNWSTAIQDAGIMITRSEPANPAYHAWDKGMVAYRRLWDSRIATDEPLVGDNMRSNGARAGIRVKHPLPAEHDAVLEVDVSARGENASLADPNVFSKEGAAG